MVTNAQAVLDTLDADQITARLDELRREESALRVLLRAARARGRRMPKDEQAKSREGRRDSR
jgi:hypothetical protein